jgi:hypothetical protein
MPDIARITFADRKAGGFSGRVLRSGEHLDPEAAPESLADQNIPFERVTELSNDPNERGIE